MRELLLVTPERAPPRKKGKSAATSAGEGGADHGVAPEDDDASSLLGEKESEVATKGSDGSGEMASQEEVVNMEKDHKLVGSGKGSPHQVSEAPKFRQPRYGLELPPALVIPVAVSPPRRQKPVEPALVSVTSKDPLSTAGRPGTDAAKAADDA